MAKIVIEYTIPPGARREDVAQFVSDALESWGGGLHPEDPMFGSLRGHMTKLVVSHKDYSELLTRPKNA